MIPYHVPGAILNICTHLIPLTILWGYNFYYCLSTDEESWGTKRIKAQSHISGRGRIWTWCWSLQDSNLPTNRGSCLPKDTCRIGGGMDGSSGSQAPHKALWISQQAPVLTRCSECWALYKAMTNMLTIKWECTFDPKTAYFIPSFNICPSYDKACLGHHPNNCMSQFETRNRHSPVVN